MSRRIAQGLVLSIVLVLLMAMSGCGNSSKQVEWITLFDGERLDGWRWGGPAEKNTWQVAGQVEIDPADPKKLAITQGEGLLVNGPTGRSCDIYTAQQFGDIEAHIEFLVVRESNSGVYFMGEYELQIFDSYGKEEVKFNDCGGIYPRWINERNVEGHAPSVNASKPPGKWQYFDVVFRAPRFDVGGRKIENARFISVKLNGVPIHTNVSLSGPTRGGMTNEEKAAGPIRLQGDHGPVAFRNLKVRPLSQ